MKPRRENSDRDNVDTSFLVKSVLGVSPIPVVGEIALSSLFYNLLKPMGIQHAGIPAALLTRFGMYTQIYFPLYEKIREIF